jgi:hypothetical protein
MDNSPVSIEVKHNFDIIAKSLGKIATLLGDAKTGASDTGKAFKNWDSSARNVERRTHEINVEMKALNEQSKKAKASFDALGTAGQKVKDSFSWTKGKIAGALGVATIGGMISGVKSYRTELLALQNTFQSMSSATGSTNAAMGTYFSLMGRTKADNATIIASMQGLEQQGVKTGKGFQELALLGADLAHSTGVSADTWQSLNGQLSQSWKVPINQIKQMNSVMIASGLSGTHLTQVINGVNGMIDKLGGYAKDGGKSAVSLAAGFTGAVTAMTKFGISAQKATEFMGKLLDPEHLQDNMLLLSKAGISYSDFTNMMTSAQGKETFFDKLGKGLPQVARQLSQIQDPIARMNFGKSLGLSAEMIQKLATAGPGEMTRIMKQAVEEAKSKDAMEKKKKEAAQAAAKLDERMHQIKMQLYTQLLPIFERNIGPFLGLLSKFFSRGGEVFGFIGIEIEKLFNNFRPFLHALLDGNWKDIPKLLGDGIGNSMKGFSETIGTVLMPMLSKAIFTAMPALLSGLWKGVKMAFAEAPWLTTLFVLYKARGALEMMWRMKMWLGQEKLIREVQALNRGEGGGVPGARSRRIKGASASAARRAARAKTGRGTTDFMSGDLFGEGGGTIGGRRGLRGRPKGIRAKLGGGMMKYGGKALGVLGAGVGLYTGVKGMMSDNQEEKKEGAGDLGAVGGGLAGAKIGALAFAWAGPVGIALGGVAGGIIGAVAGSAIGKAIYGAYEKQRSQAKIGMFESERQMKAQQKHSGGVSDTQWKMMSYGMEGQIAGAGGDNVKMNRYAAGKRHEQLSDKLMDGKELSSKGIGNSGMNEIGQFQMMQGLISQGRKGELKDLEQQLAANKHWSAEKKKQVQEEITDLKALTVEKLSSRSFEVMLGVQELQMKQANGVALNDEEKKRLEKLQGQQKQMFLNMNASAKEGYKKFASIWNADINKTHAETKKGLSQLMDAAGGVIDGGMGSIVQGLTAAGTEMQSIGSWIGDLWDSLKGGSRSDAKAAMGGGIVAGVQDFMLSKDFGTTRGAQRKSLEAGALNLRAGAKTQFDMLGASGGAGGAIKEAILKDFMARTGEKNINEAAKKLNEFSNNNRPEYEKMLEKIAVGFDAQIKQMDILDKRQAARDGRAAGIAGAIADNTKPKTERGKVSEWVDFLRASGVVEAQVVL